MNDDKKKRHAEAVRKWRSKHPEKVKFWNKRHYSRNRSERLAKNAAWMKAHPEKVREYSRRAAAKWRAANPGAASRAKWGRYHTYGPIVKAFVEQAKRSGCVRCGEAHLACLDFHHVEKSKDNRQISAMVRGRLSIKAIEDEMRKCVLLCSNCHRKEHADNAASYPRGKARTANGKDSRRLRDSRT